jgi:hypothetical protein
MIHSKLSLFLKQVVSFKKLGSNRKDRYAHVKELKYFKKKFEKYSEHIFIKIMT